MKEEDILYQNGEYWVAKNPIPKLGYEVLKDENMFASIVMRVGEGPAPNLGIERAKSECDKRAQAGGV